MLVNMSERRTFAYARHSSGRAQEGSQATRHRVGRAGEIFNTLQKLESSVQSLMQNIWQLQELTDAHRSQGT